MTDPFARLAGPLAGTTRLRLSVVAARPLTPAMTELTLTAPELAGFSHQPGQDLMLAVAITEGRPVRRRYTIRALSTAARQVTLGIVRHADGPGERWLRAAQPGDTLEGVGPRGKIFPAQGAAWHLFAGDHSALPAFFAMAGSLPPETPVRMIIEIPGREDEQPPPSGEVRWLHRAEGQARAAGEVGALLSALEEEPLPPGPGHAYLAGEAKVVLAARETLAARGMPPERVSAKAYWGAAAGNGANGEPAKA